MIALFLCALPVYDAELTPHWDDAPTVTFPEFTVTDQAGHPFSKEQLRGRIVIASFFFAQCEKMCVTLRSNLARVRDALPNEKRLLLLSHSVTQDSPEMLTAYARTNHIDGKRWKLLTADAKTMRTLEHDGYRIPLERGQQAVHTELFVLLDETQRIRGVYNGTLARDIELLIADVRALRKGA